MLKELKQYLPEWPWNLCDSDSDSELSRLLEEKEIARQKQEEKGAEAQLKKQERKATDRQKKETEARRKKEEKEAEVRWKKEGKQTAHQSSVSPRKQPLALSRWPSQQLPALQRSPHKSALKQPSITPAGYHQKSTVHFTPPGRAENSKTGQEQEGTLGKGMRKKWQKIPFDEIYGSNVVHKASRIPAPMLPHTIASARKRDNWRDDIHFSPAPSSTPSPPPSPTAAKGKIAIGRKSRR
jgi:hypothetical protein